MDISQETINEVEGLVKQLADKDPAMALWILTRVQMKVLDFLIGDDVVERDRIIDESRSIADNMGKITNKERIFSVMMAVGYINWGCLNMMEDEFNKYSNRNT